MLALVCVAAGCGGASQTTPPRPAAAATTGAVTYSNSPEDAGRLLKDTSSAVKAKVSPDLGVHFIMDSTSTVAGKSADSQAEGDMVFPNRIKMTSQTLTGGQQAKVDLIMVNGQVYTRPGSGPWQAAATSTAKPPDPAMLTSYLDFARSSRFFGQESLKGGLKTYHVQIDVDTALAAEEAEKNAGAPALKQSLEATKSATVTVDLWIGIDDHLIYQENVKTVNAGQGSSSELQFRFSSWGEPVQIKEPF